MSFFKTLLIALNLGLVSIWANGYTIDPWLIIMEPAQKKMSQVVTLKYLATNKPKDNLQTVPMEPVPVEISVLAREVDLDGLVVHPSEKQLDDFLVYPSQVVLYPGDVQKVQIQWVGKNIPIMKSPMPYLPPKLVLIWVARKI